MGHLVVVYQVVAVMVIVFSHHVVLNVNVIPNGPKIDKGNAPSDCNNSKITPQHLLIKNILMVHLDLHILHSKYF